MSADMWRLPGLRVRRGVFFGLVAVTTATGIRMMMGIVGADGFSVLEGVILALFAPTFAWIVIPFWTAVAGFALHVLRRDPLTLQPRTRRDGESVQGLAAENLTALVIPIYNENAAEVAARASAMASALVSTGAEARFHVHLLSDTSRADMAREEEAAWAFLQGTHPEIPIFYRRRDRNEGRKAGNIAEFCERCGSDYAYMVVLDADSLMSADALLRLVEIMDAHPGVGLVQAVPLPVRQQTLFGRLVQFAGWMYAPLLAAGQAFWQGESANYWGHNAIVRVAPFMHHARLPVLPGDPPLGGEILSHDFVEAALLRRGGWQVVLDPIPLGSWEELPGTLVDYARRDRRWCQGSLQHLRLLGMSGLHPLSRVHFVLGAMGYLSSCLWLLLLLAGTAYVFVPSLALPVAALNVAGRGAWGSLLGVTAALLFLPKVLGVAHGLIARRRDFGGAWRLLASALLEGLFSVLTAPVLMVYHARFVAEIAMGRSVGWDAQPRDGAAVPWATSFRTTMPALVLGLLWAGATLWLSPNFFLWMSPIFAGLLAAPGLVRWTSSRTVGQALRAAGLLHVPSETRPAPELAAVDRALASSGSDEGAPPWRVDRVPTVPVDLPAASGVPLFAPDLVGGGSQQAGLRMYNAERGLFEFGRGRSVLVTGSRASGDAAHALVTSVEGLTSAELHRIVALGDAAPRLVVTHHRASAIGLAAGTVRDRSVPAIDRMAPPVTLCLNRDTDVQTVLQLSAGHARGWAGVSPAPCPSLEAETAGLRLAQLGQLLPALVSVPVSEPFTPELEAALASGAVLRVPVDEVLRFLRTSKTEVVRVSDAPVPLSEAENSRFILFREACGLGEHVAILVGSEDEWPDPLPVRLHSACLTGDLFGSLRCDCGEQLRASMELFASRGGGALLYLAQEGRGIGLGNKFRAYTLQETGLDTIDADGTLGFGADERRYDVAVKILHELGIDRIELLTNNPEKVNAVQAAGVEVVRRRPLHGQLTRHNRPYVEAKVHRAGHWLRDMLAQSVGGD